MTPLEIGWIAGFIEGEGSFGWAQGKRIFVNISQKQREPLVRIQKLLGGRLQFCRPSTRNPIWRWEVTGSTAAGLMMTIYQLMSPRRKEQITMALGGWKSIPAWSAKRRAAGHHRKKKVAA